MAPSERLLNWLRASGDPFWVGYAEFLEYKQFFYGIFDGFCGVKGKLGDSALMNFMKLQDYTPDIAVSKLNSTPTTERLLVWMNDMDKALKKREREYNAAIRAAFERDADYVKSVKRGAFQ